MKIAFILPSLTNKGPVIAVNNLIKFLSGKVTLIDVYYFDEVKSPLHFECCTRQIQKSEFIDFDRYDIIHSHTLRADIYLHKLKRKITTTKIVSTIHQNTFQSFIIRYNVIISLLLTSYWIYIHRKFDGLISISDDLKNKYSCFLPKTTTIYNGCNVDTRATNISISSKINHLKINGYKILFSYATITKGKGLSQVLKSLVILHDFVYVIVGEGPYLDNLKKEVNRLLISDRVYFFPYQPFPYSYLNDIDLYIMPSYNEGFGLAMVEAAFEKKSIVCSNINSFKELFSESEVTFFELDNNKSLVNAIKTAYLEKEAKGNKAYLKAILCYTSEIMANNHLAYYKTLLNK